MDEEKGIASGGLEGLELSEPYESEIGGGSNRLEEEELNEGSTETDTFPNGDEESDKEGASN